VRKIGVGGVAVLLLLLLAHFVRRNVADVDEREILSAERVTMGKLSSSTS
jgi:hypothetical protein